MAGDLKAAHDKIREAAAAGQPANFRTPEGEDTPAPYDDEDAWAGRTIDGSWLAELLTSAKSTIHRYGVFVVGVRILDGLDLEAAEFPHRLGLHGCQLGPHSFNFLHSKLGVVDLAGTHCHQLEAAEARIDGNLIMAHGFTASDEVNLVGARIAGALHCDGGSFQNPGGLALCANRIHVTGGVYLRTGFTATGEVHLSGGATVGGSVECSGGIFSNPAGVALSANGINVAGSVFLRNEFTATGEVRLDGSTIGGVLSCNRASFSNPDGTALNLDNARISSGVFLRNGFVANGKVELGAATVGGLLDCSNGTFRNPGATALYAARARIGNSVFLRACEVDGEVRFVGAVVDGEMDCRGASFHNPDGRTLRMDSAQLAGLLNLSAIRSMGEIRLVRSSIGGLLDCDDSELSNPDGTALDAAWSRIGGYVRFGGDLQVQGRVSFRQAETGGLADLVSAWPERIVVAGFHYSQLTGRAEDRTWEARARWLRKQDRPRPDAYAYLAEVYRSVGDEHSARKIMMERHNTLLRPPEHWVIPPPYGAFRLAAASVWRWGSLLRRWILRVTIGHGYEPWRVLYLVVPIVLAMTVWFAHAKQEDLLVPVDGSTATASECDSSYTCVQPAVYAIDTLVPIVDFGQRSRWTPDQSRHGQAWFDDGRWLAAATWLTSALGWVIATLVAASFTQVVRRE